MAISWVADPALWKVTPLATHPGGKYFSWKLWKCTSAELAAASLERTEDSVNGQNRNARTAAITSTAAMAMSMIGFVRPRKRAGAKAEGILSPRTMRAAWTFHQLDSMVYEVFARIWDASSEAPEGMRSHLMS
jgi:hypothetical protein